MRCPILYLDVFILFPARMEFLKKFFFSISLFFKTKMVYFIYLLNKKIF